MRCYHTSLDTYLPVYIGVVVSPFLVHLSPISCTWLKSQ